MRLLALLFVVWGWLCGPAVEAARAEGVRGETDWDAWKLLPRKVDLRGEIEALGVNFLRQGMRNACAAFSATSMLELQIRRLGYDFDLSEQYVLWATKQEGAKPVEGLTTDELVNGLRAHRICREEFMPYKSSIDIIEPSAEAKANAAAMPPVQGELIAYTGIPGLSDAQIFQICRALARYEPVCFSSLWLKDGVELEKNHVMPSEDVEIEGAHMVLLTGYELTEDGEGYLLLRNSWGLGWGDFGYGRMPFEYARKYGLDAVSLSFDWSPGESREVAAGTESAKEPDLPPPGLPVYFLSLSGIYFAAGFLAFGLPALLLAQNARSPFRFLFYLVLMVLMLVLIGVVLGNLLTQLSYGERRTSLLLSLSIIGLLVICFRLPMGQFDVGFGRAFLLVMVGMLIYWPLQAFAMSWLPVPAYQEWRSQLRSIPLQDQIRFALKSQEEQSEQLTKMLPIPPEAVITVESEREWLEQWEADLVREQQLLQPDKPLARQLWERRVAAYHAQKKRFEQLQESP